MIQIEWDEVRVIESEAKRLVDIAPNLGMNMAYNMAYGSLALKKGWDRVVGQLKTLMDTVSESSCWVARAEDMSRSSRKGYKEFVAIDGQTFLDNVLPTDDCSFRVYTEEGSIIIECFHRNAILGEQYVITSMKGKSQC